MHGQTRVVLAALTVSFLCSPCLPRSAGAGDGHLDTTFGNGGTVTTDFNASFDNAKAVAIQRDGKIVVAGTVFGSTAAPGVADFAVARYNSDGSLDLDQTFGNDGKVITTVVDKGAFDLALAVAIQPDGKIIATGGATTNGVEGSNFVLIRYDTTGALDPTFGTGGIVNSHFGSTQEVARAIALQLDGRIVVAGSTATTTRNLFAVLRYNVDGTPDASFGTAGFATMDFCQNVSAQAFGVGLQYDGKIVAAGSTFGPGSAGNGDFGITRFNADGSLDTTFGLGGATITDFNVGFDSVNALAIQVDGKIVVVGSTQFGSADFAMARYEGPPAHTLTFFLHGADVPSTAGGFTMHGSPPMSQDFVIDVGRMADWFSDSTITGAFVTGARVRLVLPCPMGVSLPKLVTVASTDLAGGDVHQLGVALQGIVMCAGQETVALAIPVTTPVALINRRLRLTIATLGQTVIIPLGEHTFLDATNFVGTP